MKSPTIKINTARQWKRNSTSPAASMPGSILITCEEGFMNNVAFSKRLAPLVCAAVFAVPSLLMAQAGSLGGNRCSAVSTRTQTARFALSLYKRTVRFLSAATLQHFHLTVE